LTKEKLVLKITIGARKSTTYGDHPVAAAVTMTKPKTAKSATTPNIQTYFEPKMLTTTGTTTGSKKHEPEQPEN